MQEISVNKAEVIWEEWTGGHWLKETWVLFKTEGEGANVFCRELNIYPCGLLSLIWMMVGCKCTQAQLLTMSQEICNDKYMKSRTLLVRLQLLHLSLSLFLSSHSKTAINSLIFKYNLNYSSHCRVYWRSL